MRTPAEGRFSCDRLEIGFADAVNNVLGLEGTVDPRIFSGTVVPVRTHITIEPWIRSTRAWGLSLDKTCPTPAARSSPVLRRRPP
ncbi:hypothetical protein [Nocardioides humi]|uniref:hypothetical protein n=1 Tax=Nocardioides humi TaxID=449461 RepID=UPI00112E70C2|nr:hypothetical protein [Nocardioides humi]